MTSLWDDLESLVDSPSSFSATSGDRGTIKPAENFNAEEDAAAIKKAIDGFGTNEKVLIAILTQRSNAQRQLICKAYEKAAGRVWSNNQLNLFPSQTLEKDLKGDTDGGFEHLLVALITPPDVYDCHEVKRAMKGAGTEDGILIEIFASRSNEQIKALLQVYLQETKKELGPKLKSELSGDYCKALLLLAQGNRDVSTAVNQEQAKQDAETLYAAGEKQKWGTDEAKFIDILCKRSIAQLRQTLVEYKNLSGKTLQQSIEGEMSGDLEDLLVAVVKCVKSVPVYFAERLHESMKGGGTDESTLSRIMVSRSEVDLLDIRAEFKKLYKRSLLSALNSDTSGDYGECLKAICGGDD